MTKNKKVLAGLECCMNSLFDFCPHHCPYYEECMNRISYAPLLADCIKLLKEQGEQIKKFELGKSWDENQT